MLKKIGMLVLFSTLLAGCVTKYEYDGITYSTPEEFRHGQQSTLDGLLDNIEKMKEPIVDTCTVYTLTFQAALETTIKSVDKKSEVSKTLAEYVKNEFNFLAQAMMKRNMCNETQIIESDGMHKVANGDVPAIYLYSPDEKTSGWYYVSNKTERTPVFLDSGESDKVKKVDYFIESVKALLLSDNSL